MYLGGKSLNIVSKRHNVISMQMLKRENRPTWIQVSSTLDSAGVWENVLQHFAIANQQGR